MVTKTVFFRVFLGWNHPWRLIPLIVSGLVHQFFEWINPLQKSHVNHWGELTHLRFVGWATKQIFHTLKPRRKLHLRASAVFSDPLWDVPLTSLDVGKWSKHVEDDDQAYNDYHVGNPGCQKPTMTGDGFDHPMYGDFVDGWNPLRISGYLGYHRTARGQPASLVITKSYQLLKSDREAVRLEF